MQPGDILFVRTEGFIGAVIRWLTHSAVNHVALAVDERHIMEIQPESGVRIIENPYSRYIRARLHRALTEEEQAAIIRTAHDLVGRRYDWSLIGALLFRLFGWKTPLFRDDPSRWICSEAVDYAYLMAGIDLLQNRDRDVTPGELMQSDLLVLSLVEEEEEGEECAGAKGDGCTGRSGLLPGQFCRTQRAAAWLGRLGIPSLRPKTQEPGGGGPKPDQAVR